MNNFEQGFSRSEDLRTQLELEKIDSRTQLFSAGPDTEAAAFLDAEEVYKFERECTCQAMGLTLEPSGRIIASPTGLYLPDTNRLAYEDINSLASNNPRQLETNLRFRQAIESLMNTGESGLEHSISSPLSRVAIGVCYRYFDPEDGKEKVVFRINNDEHNRYKEWGTSLSSLVKILRQSSYPGSYVQKSFEEIIPGFFNAGDAFVPYWPEGYDTAGGRRGYKDRLESVRGISREELSNPSTDAYSSFQNFGKGERRRGLNSTSVTRFSTAKVTTPISLEFSSKEGQRAQRLNNLIANYNPVGSLELLKIIDLEIGSQRPTWLDPACGSQIAEVAIEDLAHNAEEVMGNSQYYANQEYALPADDFPAMKLRLFNGRNGSELPKEDVPGIMRMAPNIWGVAKYLAFEDRRKNLIA